LFVQERLPAINDKQRDAPLGGEDAERASSMASPRVTGVSWSSAVGNRDWLMAIVGLTAIVGVA